VEVSTRRYPTYKLSFGDAMADGTIPSSRNIAQEKFEFFGCRLSIGGILECLVGEEDRHGHAWRAIGSARFTYERV
jgi:hypothetical protein